MRYTILMEKYGSGIIDIPKDNNDGVKVAEARRCPTCGATLDNYNTTVIKCVNCGVING
jgi:uncharacterized protein (DUF983 family)